MKAAIFTLLEILLFAFGICACTWKKEISICCNCYSHRKKKCIWVSTIV